MKQIIILSATIPILLVIMLQFSLEQIKHSRNLAMENAMHEFRIASSLDFDGIDSEAEKLKQKLANIYKISTDKIDVFIAANHENKTAVYSITVPIHKIMAGAEFMNLSTDENRGTINISDTIFAVGSTHTDYSAEMAEIMP